MSEGPKDRLTASEWLRREEAFQASRSITLARLEAKLDWIAHKLIRMEKQEALDHAFRVGLVDTKTYAEESMKDCSPYPEKP